MSEIDILPGDLRDRSFSKNEIVLPCDDTLEAIRVLEENGWAILSWEGWLRYPDGRVGHSPQFQGTVDILRDPEESWQSYVHRSAAFSRDTVSQANREWGQASEESRAKLLFCISAWSKEQEESRNKK